MTSRTHHMIEKLGHEVNEEQLLEVYNTWSTTYDMDVTEDTGYVFPRKSVEILSAQLKELGFSLQARILDLGSGTGLVGQALHDIGHRNIDALDLSPECLKVAKEKGVYKNLIRGIMATENSKELGVDENEYDAAICIGVFTMGHVRGKGLDDLVHAVKPGGLACFSIRDDVVDDPNYCYNEKIEELCRDKKWKLVYKVNDIYRVVDVISAWLYVYQIL